MSMPNVELYLLKSFFNYAFFHKTFPNKNISSSEELEVFHASQFPSFSKKSNEDISFICKRLEKLEVDQNVAASYFAEHNKRSKAAKLAILALEVSECSKTYDDLIKEVATLTEDVEQGDFKEFISDDSEAILAKIKAPGLRWRLDSMNEMLGPLRKGDFGFIFARPESGKTTFLADQVTYMAEQDCGPILWFNNEQAGEVVLARCQQACFGISSQELFNDYPLWRERFRETTRGKIHIYDHASIHCRDD